MALCCCLSLLPFSPVARPVSIEPARSSSPLPSLKLAVMDGSHSTARGLESIKDGEHPKWESGSSGIKRWLGLQQESRLIEWVVPGVCVQLPGTWTALYQGCVGCFEQITWPLDCRVLRMRQKSLVRAAEEGAQSQRDSHTWVETCPRKTSWQQGVFTLSTRTGMGRSLTTSPV